MYPTTGKGLERRGSEEQVKSHGDSRKVTQVAESETERKLSACACERDSALLRPPGSRGGVSKKDGAEGRGRR